MKKRWTKFLIAAFLLASLLQFGVSAEGEVELPEEFEKVIDGLPSEIDDYLPSEIHSGDIEGVSEAVSRMSNGEYLMSIIGEMLGIELKKKLSLFTTLIGIILLVAIFHSFRTGLVESAISRAVGFCSVALIFAVMSAALLSDLEALKLFFERIEALMVGVIPAVSVIYAMGGNVTTAAASSSTFYMFLAFCETVCANTVIPVTAMLTSFSMCGALCPNIQLGALSSALKKCYTVFLTLVMSILLFVLSSQTLLSASADSITARAAKLMASSAIPIVGGSVGESLRTVGATVSYIKSVTGLGGIFFIFILVLPTVISLLITRLFLILTASVAEMLGCQSEGRALSDIGGIYGTLIAVVSSVAVTFILALGVFVRCSVALR